MLYAHTDFLSYEDIDRDVDQIYRAFCDTTLIEYVKNNARNSQAYWAKVVAFRRQNLSPFDRPDFARKASSDQTLESTEQSSTRVSQAEFEHARTFLYWFDVRAEYWAQNGADQNLADILVPADQLRFLYEQAKSVQQRISGAQGSAKALEWVFGAKGGKNDLLIARIIEFISRFLPTPSEPPPPGN
jgi:hypothetical protein